MVKRRWRPGVGGMALHTGRREYVGVDGVGGLGVVRRVANKTIGGCAGKSAGMALAALRFYALVSARQRKPGRVVIEGGRPPSRFG